MFFKLKNMFKTRFHKSRFFCLYKNETSVSDEGFVWLHKYAMAVINAVREPYCKLCSPVYGWSKTRGLRGKGNPDNLIQLCTECHDLAQQ
jgi:hypothetical protein